MRCPAARAAWRADARRGGAQPDSSNPDTGPVGRPNERARADGCGDARWPEASAEQRVRQPGVAEADLRRPDLTLADVRVPRLALPHHQRLGQVVAIAPDRRFAHAERAGGIGCVPHLAVQVRQLRPEAQHRRRGHVRAELRQVALDESPGRLDAPLGGVPIASAGSCRSKQLACPAGRKPRATAILAGETSVANGRHVCGASRSAEVPVRQPISSTSASVDSHARTRRGVVSQPARSAIGSAASRRAMPSLKRA
jgi:hypothetical protein